MGVATLEARVVYAHCYSHALNLAASNMLKQSALLEDAISTSHKAIKTYTIIHPEENAYISANLGESLSGDHMS